MKDYENFSVENYQSNEKLINGIWANILCLIIFLVFGGVSGLIYYNIWGEFVPFQFNFSLIGTIYTIMYIIVFLAFLLVYELITALVWSKYTKVTVNVIMKSLWRFFACEEAIKIKHYIFGLIMPTIILGILPMILGLILKNYMINIFGIIFVAAGSQNFIVVNQLKKEDKHDFVKDIESKVGIIIYRKNK
jgi:hypothetical protein